MPPLMRLLCRLPTCVIVNGVAWEITDLPASVPSWSRHVLANQIPDGETWIFYLGANDQETTDIRLYHDGFDIPIAATPPRDLAEQLIREGRAEILA